MPISITKQIDVEQSLREDLSQYLCGSIWNHPLTELRRNIVLRAMNKGKCTKHICDIGSVYTPLPDVRDGKGQTHEYYVYAAACCCMGGLVIDCEQDDVLRLTHFGEWIRLDQYLNIRPFDLRIHSVYGEWLNRNCIYIKNHPTEDMFLLAIDARMADKILGNDYNFSTVYMSVYYDSDNDMNHLDVTSPKIYSYRIETQEQINDVYERYLKTNHDQTFFFINGRQSYPSSLLDMTIGDYVELVNDPDIIANIVLDMVQVRDSHLYSSEIDGSLKYIIHIPKEKNKNNLILTHNTCDIFINPLNTSPIENANLKGLFVHRFDTSHREYTYVETSDKVYRRGREYFVLNASTNTYTKKYLSQSDYGTEIVGKLYVRSAEYLSDSLITQITHNDFGISQKLLQPYMDIIGSSECSIRVVVRRHNKSNVLDRDCNFIKLLYQFDDETILNFLNGKLLHYCPFWQASELEKSEWTKTLFEVPKNIYPESAGHYIAALGYYNSACVIAPRVVSGVYNKQNEHALEFTIPRSLQDSNALDALFTVNGKLLRTDKYSCTKVMQYLHFDIDQSVQLSPNDKLIAEVFEKKQVYAEYFTPTGAASTFDIPEEAAESDFELYLVKDGCDVKPDYFVDHYVDKSDLRGYKKLDDVSGWIVLPTTDTYRTETVDSSCIDNGCDNPSHQGSTVVQVLAKRTITFKPDSWNKTFLIVSKDIYDRYTEADIALCHGNTQLSTLHDPDKTRTCSELLHTGKLMIRCRKWSDGTDIAIPIINKEWNVIPYCNGRELVENIDYSDVVIKDAQGYVVYRTLLFAIGGFGKSNSLNDSSFYEEDSYLKYENNEFDIVITDDRMFSRLDGFAFSNEMFSPNTPIALNNTGRIEEMLPLIYWFNELSKLVVDGNAIYKPTIVNGRLQFSGNHRNGALYCSRGIIPTKTAYFVEKYLDSVQDVEKLARIVNYIRSLDKAEDPDITVISHSHHITSITTNCLIKDVITGAKELYWTSAKNQINEMVEEYRSMAKYDSAISGSVKDIEISSSGSAIINDKYHLVEITATGNDREWTNTNGKCFVSYNEKLSRWEIVVVTIYGKSVYYHAVSADTRNPWELRWVRENGESPIPVFTNYGINHKFVDILPSYTSDIHEVEEDIMLRRCVDALLPTDTTKDGATTL